VRLIRFVLVFAFVLAWSIEGWTVTWDVPSGECPTIQTGIDSAAVGDTVLVANGLYSGSGNRDLDFGGKDITVRSASDDPNFCIIHCGGSEGNEHRGFYFHSGETNAARVEGFAIINGYAWDGGAISLANVPSSPSIRNCIIQDNYSRDDGGGIHCAHTCAPVITGCTIRNNSCPDNGGGIHAWNAHPVVTDCVIAENSSGDHGGGLFFDNHSDPVISGCVIFSNTATDVGGGICCINTCSLSVETSTFYENSGVNAGGIAIYSNSEVLVDRTIIASSALNQAVYCESGGTATVTCSDIHGNAGGDWVGCIAGQGSINGNFSEDPVFCDAMNEDFQLRSDSPCLSGPGCGQVGALGLGCSRIWHVPADAPTIQAGIDSAAYGDTVEVACGTYTYTNQGSSGGLMLYLKSGIVLRSETGQPDCATIDAEGQGKVILCEQDTCSIKGFTITGGLSMAPGLPGAGAGLKCSNSLLEVRDCVFSGNQSLFETGGGMYGSTSSVTVTGCVFDGNSAPNSSGGGLCLVSCSDASTITGCTFVSNSAHVGGGLASWYSEPILVASTFSGNTASEDGGGLYLQITGGSPVLIDCVFSDNSASEDGGGASFSISGGSPFVTGNTFCSNSAGDQGGGIHCSTSSATLTVANTIIAFSDDGEGVYSSSIGGVDLSCCDVYGNADGDWVGNIAGQLGLDGNISADPHFCSPEEGDFHLRPCSPCSNAPGCGEIGALGGEDCARSWYVPADAPTIQAGIDSARCGDYVVVAAGTYYEHDIVMKSGVQLYGDTDEPDRVTIDAQSSGRVFYCENLHPSTRIDGFTITGGSSDVGGGIYCASASIDVANCVFSGNTATVDGGALYCSDSSSPSIYSCTFSGNSASSSGAVLWCGSQSTPNVERSILAHSPQGEAVYCDDGLSVPSFSCCDIYGNAGGDWTGCIADQASQDGNFSVNPLFCCRAADNYHLRRTSPCLDVPGCGPVGALGQGCGVAWYVPADVPTIQAGIDSAVAGDTVLVACGTYTWTGEATGIAESMLIMKSGIVLRSETGEADCVAIDAEGLGRVFYCASLDTTRIEGITIANGAPASSNDPGAGVYCSNSALFLTDCVLSSNTGSTQGGGIFALSSLLSLDHCDLDSNSTQSRGGAIYADNETQISLAHCTITSNIAMYSGGGIYCDDDSPLTLTDCILASNSTGSHAGGAIYCEDSSPADLTRCTLYSNSAVEGGGLYCRTSSPPSLTQCVVAFGQGGAWCEWDTSSLPTVNCCDIYANAGGDSLFDAGGSDNFSEDPGFCDAGSGDFTLCDASPCLPANNGCGVQIGALGAGECSCVGPACGVIRVPDDYPTITEALAAASWCDTVLVDPGTYPETIHLPWGVALLATEGPDSTVIDAVGQGTVVFIGYDAKSTLLPDSLATTSPEEESAERSVSGPSAVLEGFTITGGTESGIRIIGANPIVRDCTISGNSTPGGMGSSDGGGIYCGNASPTISQCRIQHNTSGGSGGGMAFYYSSASVSECVLLNNAAQGSSGGGIRCYESSLTVTQCTLCGNTARQGGGIYCYQSSPIVSNCIIAFSHSGGALYCSYGGDPTVTCCNLYGNGGGNSVCGTNGGGNISSDPGFCDAPGGDLTLCADSPCLPENNGCGVLMGALGLGSCPCPTCQTIRVPDDYPTISEALAAARYCDVVEVDPGTYPERIQLPWGVTLRSTGGAASTIIDAGGQGTTVSIGYGPAGGEKVSPEPENMGGNPDRSTPARVEGFTITGGNPSGIRVLACDPEIAECVISGNTASSGAGVDCYESSPLFTNCTITSNVAEYSGGGVYCHGYDADLNPTFDGCTFSFNSVLNTPGTGGGAYLTTDRSELRDCVFYSNSSYKGGGVYWSYIEQAMMDGCTLCRNAARYGSGVYCRSSDPGIDRSIIAFGQGGEAIYCEGGDPTVSCCNIYANAGGDSICGTDMGDNISENPLFCDQGAGDLYLCAASPCLPENNDCHDLIGALGSGGCPCPECAVIQVPGDYGTIAEALAAASLCDTVEVGPGTYPESIVIPEGVTLRSSAGPASTTIAGVGGAVVTAGYSLGKAGAKTASIDSAATPGVPAGTRTTPPGAIQGFTITGGTDAGVRVEYAGLEISECIVVGNAGPIAGGIYLYHASASISNCTICDNSARSSGGGAGIYCSDSSPLIVNCIVAFSDGGQACYCSYASAPTWTSCCIHGNAEGDDLCGIDGGDNLFENPLFCDQGGGDYQLCSDSSCLPDNNPQEELIGALGDGGCACPECRALRVPAEYSTIGDALAAASYCDTVIVSPGTWPENIYIPWGVTLRSVDGPASTTIDGENGTVVSIGYPEVDSKQDLGPEETNRDSNCASYWGGKGRPGPVESIASIRGFTITGGTHSGVQVQNCSPTIHNCVVTGNSAEDGGGMYFYSASVAMESCTVYNNSATDDGGGIHAQYSVSNLAASTLSSNFAGDAGGGFFTTGAGSLTSCIVFDNSAAQYGGGLFLDDANATISKCTLVGNSSVLGGGVYVKWDDSSREVDLANSVVAFNDGGGGVYCDAAEALTVTCCDLFGNAGGDDFVGIDGGGNISDDPQFCDWPGGDLAVCDSSPCLPGNNGCGVLMGALGSGGCACPECSTYWVTSNTISEVLAIASYCDTIMVSAGTFAETLVIPHGVTLIGAGPDLTIIDGGGQGTVVSLGEETDEGRSAPGGLESVVQGVTITGGTESGVRILTGGPAIQDCVIRNNSGTEAGGLFCGESTSPSIRNCTIIENSGDPAGGVYCAEASSVDLQNSIIAFSDTGAAVIVEDYDASASLTCCDVYQNAGGWGGIGQQIGINGNFSEDPLFCYPTLGTAVLRSDSPCAPENNPGCGLVGALGVGCDPPRVWYVPGDAPTIQAGVDSAALDDTVVVACGTYYEHDIPMKSGIVLRSETGIADCVTVNAQRQGRVFSCENVESSTRIQGFTLTGGRTDFGGCLHCVASSPTLVDCSIYDNIATGDGGGLHCVDQSSPTLTDCTVLDNAANVGGGGIYCENGSSPTLTGCLVAANSAAAGGALVCWDNSSPQISHCTLSHNSASSVGGGFWCGVESVPVVDKSILTFCGSGAAVHSYDAQSVPVFSCTDIFGNAGGDWTDGIADQYGQSGNISENPLFCDAAAGDYELWMTSPCAPDNSPCPGELIGALPVGCIGGSVPEEEAEMPGVTQLFLGPAVPNPFNPVTEIRYGIPAGARPSRVTMNVYDSTGRRVVTLVDTETGPGIYTVTWDGTDHNGVGVASGVYFYRITWNGEAETKRMVLLK
jgi:predicted outer membrane repeat protein